MSTEPRNTPVSPSVTPATETTAVLRQSEGAYGARFDEDAFNYPSPAAPQAWPGDEPPPKPTDAAGPADAAGPVDEPDAAKRARGRSRQREAGGWQQRLARRRPVLAVAAALMVMGGFGFALSAVSDTVSSDPTPVGTARDPAPKSPSEQPSLPGATASATSPPVSGVGVLPTPTGSLPATGDRHEDEDDQDQQEEQQHEDRDRSDDD